MISLNLKQYSDKMPNYPLVILLVGGVILAVLFSYTRQSQYVLDTDNIHYIRDEKTGVCFAYVGSQFGFQDSVGLTQVDCSVLPD